VCTPLHFNIYQEIGVKLDNEHWYDHVPKSVDTSHEGTVTILRNQQVRTDRTIPNNKTENLIHYNKKSKIHASICCNFWRHKCDQDRN
jgi:hypothetical protein